MAYITPEGVTVLAPVDESYPLKGGVLVISLWNIIDKLQRL